VPVSELRAGYDRGLHAIQAVFADDTLHRYIQTSYSYSQVNCPCALQSTLLATLGRLYEFVLLALASPCLSVSRFHSRPSTVSLT
jgi:hypothetical protein